MAANIVSRVLAVLQVLSESEGALSLQEIARACALPPPSAHRLLKQLVAEGMAVRAPGRTYRRGPELFAMATRCSRRSRRRREITLPKPRRRRRRKGRMPENSLACPTFFA